MSIWYCCSRFILISASAFKTLFRIFNFPNKFEASFNVDFSLLALCISLLANPNLRFVLVLEDFTLFAYPKTCAFFFLLLLLHLFDLFCLLPLRPVFFLFGLVSLIGARNMPGVARRRILLTRCIGEAELFQCTPYSCGFRSPENKCL